MAGVGLIQLTSDKVQYILQYLIMGLRNTVGRQKISKRTYGYEMDQLLKMSFHCVSQPGLEALSLSLCESAGTWRVTDRCKRVSDNEDS